MYKSSTTVLWDPARKYRATACNVIDNIECLKPLYDVTIYGILSFLAHMGVRTEDDAF